MYPSAQSYSHQGISWTSLCSMTLGSYIKYWSFNLYSKIQSSFNYPPIKHDQGYGAMSWSYVIHCSSSTVLNWEPCLEHKVLRATTKEWNRRLGNWDSVQMEWHAVRGDPRAGSHTFCDKRKPEHASVYKFLVNFHQSPTASLFLIISLWSATIKYALSELVGNRRKGNERWKNERTIIVLGFSEAQEKTWVWFQQKWHVKKTQELTLLRGTSWQPIWKLTHVARKWNSKLKWLEAWK